MKLRAALHRVPGLGQEALVLFCVLLLLAFTYGTRADLLGSRGPGDAWRAVSGRPVAPAHHFVAAGILLGLLPVLAGLRLLRTDLRGLGLGWGRPRRGLAWLAAGLPLAVVAGKIASGSPAMQAVYPLDPGLPPEPGPFAVHALLGFLYYGSWEVLFRGVLLFGLKDRIGVGAAIMLQTALSVTAHFGRPFDETFSAVPAGIVFAGIDLHIGSIWYVALIHWVLGMSMDWFIVAGA